MSYGDIDLVSIASGNEWLFAWWHQTISLTNVDFPPKVLYDESIFNGSAPVIIHNIWVLSKFMTTFPTSITIRYILTPHFSRSWPRSNFMVIEAFSSIYMCTFHFAAINWFWMRYSKFHIWPWKFKVKVTVKVKSYGHIWGIEFNRYFCFSFRGTRIIFGWDIANSIINLQNSRSQWWKSTKI